MIVFRQVDVNKKFRTRQNKTVTLPEQVRWRMCEVSITDEETEKYLVFRYQFL